MTDEGERLGGGVAGNDVPRVYGTVVWTLRRSGSDTVP